VGYAQGQRPSSAHPRNRNARASGRFEAETEGVAKTQAHEDRVGVRRHGFLEMKRLASVVTVRLGDIELHAEALGFALHAPATAGLWGWIRL
jgi:hypothetical protein